MSDVAVVFQAAFMDKLAELQLTGGNGMALAKMASAYGDGPPSYEDLQTKLAAFWKKKKPEPTRMQRVGASLAGAGRYIADKGRQADTHIARNKGNYIGGGAAAAAGLGYMAYKKMKDKKDDE